jgi:hypothetical protein
MSIKKALSFRFALKARTKSIAKKPTSPPRENVKTKAQAIARVMIDEIILNITFFSANMLKKATPRNKSKTIANSLGPYAVPDILIDWPKLK